MIRKVLSLLLSFLVLNVQLMAAGPFDAYVDSSRPLTPIDIWTTVTAPELAFSKISGTYGLTLTGVNSDHESTTGTVLLSIPSRGLAVGKVILFDQGLMYFGNCTGVFRNAYLSSRPSAATFPNPRSVYSSLDHIASGALICQLAHYSIRTTSDGIAGTSSAILDGMMNGVLNLRIAASALVSPLLLEGEGSLWHYETRLLNVVSTTMTRDGSNQLDSPGSNPTNFTSTITVTGSEPGDLSNLIQGGKIPDAGNSDWLSTNGFDSPNLINTDSKSAYVALYVEGEMQSTANTSVAGALAFSTPAASNWNWGVGLGTGVDGTRQNEVVLPTTTSSPNGGATFPPGFTEDPLKVPLRNDGVFSR